MMMRSVLALALAVLGAAGALSQNCRYVHPVAAPSDVYHRVEVPVGAMTLDPYGSRQLDQGYPDDLRVFGLTAAGDTLEVPYVYEGPAASTSVLTYLPIRNPGRVGTAYRYTVEVADARELDALELQLANANFEGRVTVEGANALGDFQTIAEDIRIVALRNGAADFEYARLRFPPSRYRYYRLTIGGIPDLVLQRVVTASERTPETRRRRYGGHLELSVPKRDGSATELLYYLDERALVDRVTVHVADTAPYSRPANLTTTLRPPDSTPIAYRDRPTGYASGTLTREDSVLLLSDAVAEIVSVKLKNGDDAPLSYDSVTVEGPRRFLAARFPEGVTAAFLSYGCADRGAPDYDLARLREQIPEGLSTLALGTAEARGGEVEEEVPPDWSSVALWAALLVVAVVIGVSGVRLLRG